MVQKISKKSNFKPKKKDVKKHKITKNTAKSKFQKTIKDENTNLTKTINKNIEQMMMAKAAKNQEYLKLVKPSKKPQQKKKK